MIFVTVGGNPFNFDRLIKKVDELISEKKIKEKVVMQIGNSSYRPKDAEWFDYTTPEKMISFTRRSRVVITHGGAGSILIALKYGKPVIAVPRLQRFNEHTDDHQIDLVKTMNKEGVVIGVFDLDDLEDAIKSAKISKIKSTKHLLVKEINRYLLDLAKTHCP